MKNGSQRLDVFLVESGHVSSRARANTLIREKKVTVDGLIVSQPAKHVCCTARIELLEEEIPWVSRAALKLIAALDAWNISVSDRVVLDVGSSTGGFTQVLLSRGAAHVYAVDVGTQQLHDSLRNNAKITLCEGLHIKDVTSDLFQSGIPDMTVIDVSFISLAHVLPKVSEITSGTMDVVALIKPQFEVGRKEINKGIVKNPALHDAACQRVARTAESFGFSVQDIIDSPVLGGDGNKEFLLFATIKK